MSLLDLELPDSPRPIVLIGAGGIVRDAHLPAYRKAGFPVAGIFDINPDQARSTADLFGIRTTYGNLDEAIRQAPQNAVFDVAIPASALFDTLRRLPDGRGVLMQKPMGENLADARQIRDLCRAKNLTAAVNFQMRYAPAIRSARRLITDGAIGELHDLEIRITVYTPWHLWTFLEAAPRVEILYHSIHYLDLIRSFFGDPRGIYAKTMKHPKFAKLASTRSNVILDYGDLRRANFETNHGHEYGLRHQESYVKWEGTNGAIKTQLGLLMDYPKGVPDNFEFCILNPGEAPRWQTLAVEGTWFPDAFMGTMADLMCFLDGKASILPTAVDDAYKTMALVEAAHESSDSGATAIAYD